MNIFFKKNILHIIFLQIFIFVFFVSSAQAILTEGVGNWGMSNPSMVSTTYEKFTDTIGATSKVNKCRSLFLVKDNTYTKIRDVFAGDADCVEGTDDCADASAFDEDKDGNPSVEANAKFCVVKKGLTKGLDINNDLNFPDELTTPTSVARGVDYNDCEHIFASKDNRWAERLSGTTCPYIGWTPVQDLSAVPEALGVKWPKDVENPDTLSMAWDEFGRRHIYVFKGNKSREYTDFNRPYFYKTDDKGLSYSICTFFETTYSSLANLNCTKIGDANYPPTLATLSNQTAMVGKFFNYNVRASDLDGDKLIWKYKIDGVDVSSSNSKDFTYCSSGSIESTCTVGDACVNTDTVPVAGTCKKWTISFGDTSQNNVKKIYTTAPPFTINKKITVTVGDDDGKGAGTVNATDTESFDLSVIKTGLAITSTPVKFVRVTSEFASYAYDVEAYDPDNYYPLTYSWNFVSPSTAFPEGLNASSINQYNGLIMGTIAGTGKNTVKVTVTNSNTPPASTTQAFTIESVDNYCGNNVTSTYGILADYYEECDDGNIDSTDKCDTYDKNGYGECKATFCGDGKIETPNGRDFSSAQPIDQTSGFNEECDDGTGTGAGRGSNDYKTQPTDLPNPANPTGKDAGSCIIDIDESPKGIYPGMNYFYDAEEVPGSKLAGISIVPDGATSNHLYSATGYIGTQSSDFLAVDPTKIFTLKGKFKSTGSLPSLLYFGLSPYDINKNSITDYMVVRTGNDARISSATATNIITANGVSGWTQPSHKKLGFYFDGDTSHLPDYVHIPGYSNVVDGDTNIVVTGFLPIEVLNRIDPGVTVVKNHHDNSTHLYVASAGANVPVGSFTNFSGTITGEGFGNDPNMFRLGTKYVKILILPNYQQDSSYSLEFDDIVFGEGGANSTHGCSDARCGDGYYSQKGVNGISGGGDDEECDDFGWGWGDNTDQCTDTCTLTGCGDGTTQNPNGLKTGGSSNIGNEVCDDGVIGDRPSIVNPSISNPSVPETGKCLIDETKFSSNYGCVNARCGDGYFSALGPNGVVGPVGPTNDDEMCDDGDVVDTNNDTCDTIGTNSNSDGPCTFTFLGDGTSQAPNGYDFSEVCDDGDTDVSDDCNTFGGPGGAGLGTDAFGHTIGGTDAGTKTRCGDGYYQFLNGEGTGGPAPSDGHEQCDGLELNSKTCTSPEVGNFTSGTLACNLNCTFNTAGCVSTCKFDDSLAVFDACVFGP
jgi:hypothetical protein